MAEARALGAELVFVSLHVSKEMRRDPWPADRVLVEELARRSDVDHRGVPWSFPGGPPQPVVVHRDRRTCGASRPGGHRGPDPAVVAAQPTAGLHRQRTPDRLAADLGDRSPSRVTIGWVNRSSAVVGSSAGGRDSAGEGVGGADVDVEPVDHGLHGGPSLADLGDRFRGAEPCRAIERHGCDQALAPE